MYRRIGDCRDSVRKLHKARMAEPDAAGRVGAAGAPSHGLEDVALHVLRDGGAVIVDSHAGSRVIGR